MAEIKRRKERRGTSTALATANEVVGEGEIVFAKDSSHFKIGPEGGANWNSIVDKYEAELNGIYNLRSAAGLAAAISALSTGGMLAMPRGAFSVGGDNALPNANVWAGRGSDPDATIGSIWRLTENGKSIFKITGFQRNIHIQDMAFDCMGRTGATGINVVKGTGNAALPTFNLSFHRLNFSGGEYGINISDTVSHGWQVTGVAIVGCYFNLQTIACVNIDTANQKIYLLGNTMTPAGNGAADAISLKYSGTTLIMNNAFNGFDINPKTQNWTFVAADVTAATNIVTKTGVLSITGDPVYLISTGTLPGGLYNTQRYFIRKTGNDYSFFWTSKDAQNNVNVVDITDGGSGTHTVRAISRPILTGRPRAAISTQGQNGQLMVVNNEEEGIANFLNLSGNNDTSRAILMLNNLVQSAMKFNSNYKLISIANHYPVRSFLDEIGVRSEITSIGDSVWTPDGAGATYRDLGGYDSPPFPWHLSNFSGDSVIDVERETSFDPSDLIETILYLDPELSYNQANGSTITTSWTDKSKRKGTCPVTGSPTFETNALNGHPVIRLGNVTNDYFTLPTYLPGFLWYYAFEVIKINVTSNGGYTWGTDAANRDHYIYGDGKAYGAFATTARKAGIVPTVNVTTWHEREYCSGPGYWSFLQNGVVVQETTTNTPGWPTVARLGYNGTEYMNSSIATFILLVGTRKLELQKIRKIRDFIKDKWGVG